MTKAQKTEALKRYHRTQQAAFALLDQYYIDELEDMEDRKANGMPVKGHMAKHLQTLAHYFKITIDETTQ